MSNFRDRFEEEVERIGVSAISRDLGVARNTIYNWIAKGNVPLNRLMALEGVAGLDIQYVITGQASGETERMTPDEELLIESYRQLDAKERRQLLSGILSGATLGAGGNQVKVSGNGGRVAGGNYYEGKKE